MQHDPNRYKQIFESLNASEIEEMNRRNHEEHLRQVTAFRSSYAEGKCYLCGDEFDQMRAAHPCTHWLLRRGKFKKNDFSKIFEKYDYHNIAAFLRWCANEEAFLKNINDLSEERAARKILSTTIKWKNIEWTFDCSENDYQGHAGTHSSFPHYHFQMRIDGRQFINFNDFHIPFSDRDLFQLSLRDEPWMHQDFGAAGSGMEDAVSIDPELLLEHTAPTDDENSAHYHFSTMIEAIDKPITGEELHEILEEAKRTNKSFAYVARQRLKDRANIQTVVSPGEGVPDIAARTEHKR